MNGRGGFAKVFSSLWDGTLADRWETWSVFVFMLAHSDAEGVVDMTPEAIARRSCIPVDKVRAALEVLMAPDPNSRTPDHDGRRIVLIDEHRTWGWRVVNHGAYRNRRDTAERKAQNRDAQVKRRERQHLSATVSHRQPRVSHCQPPSAIVSHVSAYAEAEADAEAERVNNGVVADGVGDEVSEPLRGADRRPAVKRARMAQDGPEAVVACVDSSGTARGDCGPTSSVHDLPVAGGGTWQPKVEQLEAWHAAFPALDLDRELAAARAWLLANPTRGKTRRGMAAFVQRWLARSGADAARPSARGSRTGADARYLAAQAGVPGVIEGRA